MTLDDLRSEYRDQTMGPKIIGRVRTLVQQMLRHRDPLIYAHGSFDRRDGEEDVLNDFTEKVLLGGGQLAYFFDNATSVEHFDALVNKQLRNHLSRTRQRTIIDNLLDRAVAVMKSDDLVVVVGGERSERFIRSGIEEEAVKDPFALRAGAAVAANSVPKIYTNPDDRNPKVYSDSDLATLLRVFLGEVKCAINRGDLHKLFENLLTPWLTTVLGLDEVADDGPRMGSTMAPGKIGPDDELLVDEAAERIASGLSAEDVVVFRYKHANMSDTQLAERLNVSRPTAANKKDRLFEKLRSELGDLEAQLRPLVLGRIVSRTDGVTL